MSKSDVARTGESDGHRTASQILNGQSEGEAPEASPMSTIILVLALIILSVLAAAKKLTHGIIPARLVRLASEWA